MTALANELRALVSEAELYLLRITHQEARQPRGEDGWAPIEIIGHLIDSASNNHGRFVRARAAEDLVFPGYDQDAWVTAQQYLRADWWEVIDLWAAFNQHLARVIESTPKDVAERPRSSHNLDEIAWKPVPKDEDATLAYFMTDYVSHIRHHLAQLGLNG